MKVIILFSVLFFAVSAKSQSLKEALFGGKLKADTGAVLRKGDSLKIKENMAQKTIADSIKKETIAAEKQAAIVAGKDTSVFTEVTKTDVPVNSNAPANTNAPGQAIPGEVIAAEAVTEKTIPKDNNKIWKDFINEFTTTIKSEVLTSGKIKKGTYSVLIDYAINPDGQVEIKSVASDPQSSFLDQQIKDRLILNAPQLNPVMGTNGKPRTVAKKQMLTFTK